MTESKEGWCNHPSELTKDDESPNNQYFKIYENKLIIGKSSIEDENYKLVFCCRDVESN